MKSHDSSASFNLWNSHVQAIPVRDRSNLRDSKLPRLQGANANVIANATNHARRLNSDCGCGNYCPDGYCWYVSQQPAAHPLRSMYSARRV